MVTYEDLQYIVPYQYDKLLWMNARQIISVFGPCFVDEKLLQFYLAITLDKQIYENWDAIKYHHQESKPNRFFF